MELFSIRIQRTFQLVSTNFLLARLFFANEQCKAWRKKIPERSEDDFFPANQPDRAALHSQWQRAIFAVRNEILNKRTYFSSIFLIHS